MRVISGFSIVFAFALFLSLSGFDRVTDAAGLSDSDGDVSDSGERHRRGRAIFRFDTFGDEQLWTDVLKIHEAIAALDPKTALEVAGLKVDVEALPRDLIRKLRAGEVDLTDPAVTIELLRLNAVVGVRGRVDSSGEVTSVGITCALCHSTVDNALDDGIGRRLDGWANTDLDVGAILALSPALEALKNELLTWGPGKYDPRHHAFDGVSLKMLNTPSHPIVIPPIYGLRGVGFETVTGDGPISYWNSYVGVGQMGGQGNFHDPRINLTITQFPDRVTPKLRRLLEYQLSLRVPEPPRGSFDRRAARRGERIFQREAQCASCHRPPNFTDVLSGPIREWPFLHAPSEVGTDPLYASRSATGQYRTTPLRALWQHPPYFHDGSAADLPAVVEHYDRQFRLGLSEEQKADLVEFLKSI